MRPKSASIAAGIGIALFGRPSVAAVSRATGDSSIPLPGKAAV